MSVWQLPDACALYYSIAAANHRGSASTGTAAMWGAAGSLRLLRQSNRMGYYSWSMPPPIPTYVLYGLGAIPADVIVDGQKARAVARDTGETLHVINATVRHQRPDRDSSRRSSRSTS
jgi:hypothetical protein